MISIHPHFYSVIRWHSTFLYQTQATARVYMCVCVCIFIWFFLTKAFRYFNWIAKNSFFLPMLKNYSKRILILFVLFHIRLNCFMLYALCSVLWFMAVWSGLLLQCFFYPVLLLSFICLRFIRSTLIHASSAFFLFRISVIWMFDSRYFGIRAYIYVLFFPVKTGFGCRFCVILCLLSFWFIFYCHLRNENIKMNAE